MRDRLVRPPKVCRVRMTPQPLYSIKVILARACFKSPGSGKMRPGRVTLKSRRAGSDRGALQTDFAVDSQLPHQRTGLFKIRRGRGRLDGAFEFRNGGEWDKLSEGPGGVVQQQSSGGESHREQQE